MICKYLAQHHRHHHREQPVGRCTQSVDVYTPERTSRSSEARQPLALDVTSALLN